MMDGQAASLINPCNVQKPVEVAPLARSDRHAPEYAERKSEHISKEAYLRLRPHLALSTAIS